LYDRLGVAPTATLEEIRAAYRRIARRVHPDRGTAGNEQAMAAANEAWRVLSDPGRRAEYDASLRTRSSTLASSPSRASAPAPAPAEDDDLDEEQGPRQLWVVALPAVLVLVVLGGIFLFTAYARGGPGTGTTIPGGPVDGIIQVGSCVELDSQARALETPCGGPHHGIVRAIVAAQAACPLRTEGYYEPDGSHLVCISTA
jgi:curved DNA-binding protein CbpA